MRLMNLADWLWGCSHRRTTLPMTKNDETYVVCELQKTGKYTKVSLAETLPPGKEAQVRYP